MNILVTGGAKGIGKCISEKLALEGHNVILNYNTSQKEAEEIKLNMKKSGYNIEIFKADVSKREEVKKLIEYSIEKLENIDVLINNAGISQIKLFTDITDDDWNKMINNNLNSVFYMIQEILPFMINRKEGKIINISSVWGMIGASCETHYAVAKAGIDAITKSLAKELGPSNIKINSIAPGIIDTNMNSELKKQELEEIKEEIPLERIGKPEDVYRVVKWLIDDEYTTGQIISPNGGWVIN